MPVLQVRMSDSEMDSLKAAALAETVHLSAFVRGILFPAPGKPLTAEQPKDIVVATLVEPGIVPASFKPMSREPTPIRHPPKSNNFKRSPKCTSSKCERTQMATCDPCRAANAKGFA